MTDPVVTYVDLEDVAEHPPAGWEYMKKSSYNALNVFPYTLEFGIDIKCQFGKDTKVSMHSFRFHVHARADRTVIDSCFGGLWHVGHPGDKIDGETLNEFPTLYRRLREIVAELLPEAFETAVTYHSTPPAPRATTTTEKQTYVGEPWQA